MWADICSNDPGFFEAGGTSAHPELFASNIGERVEPTYAEVVTYSWSLCHPTDSAVLLAHGTATTLPTTGHIGKTALGTAKNSVTLPLKSITDVLVKQHNALDVKCAHENWVQLLLDYQITHCFSMYINKL